MNEVLNKIKSRGFWEVVIRPVDFCKDKITELQTLKHIITQKSVSSFVRSFPHISTEMEIQNGLDWVEQWGDWGNEFEAWRFYKSGQFVYYGSMRDDWWDRGRPNQKWEPGAYLTVGETISQYTVIFEFAARLALTEAGSETMIVSIVLNGLKERRLQIINRSGKEFDPPRICYIESFPQTKTVPRQELVAEPKLLALEASKELFIRFNWTPNIEILRGM